jgi:hypothetical protein
VDVQQEQQMTDEITRQAFVADCDGATSSDPEIAGCWTSAVFVLQSTLDPDTCGTECNSLVNCTENLPDNVESAACPSGSCTSNFMNCNADYADGCETVGRTIFCEPGLWFAACTANTQLSCHAARCMPATAPSVFRAV